MKTMTTVLALGLSVLVSTASAMTPSSSKPNDMSGAMTDLTLAAANHGYQLVKVQPMDNALVKRGYADPGVRVAFIGKAEQVEQAVATDPALLSLLPMRIVMVREGDSVRITGDDLEVWKRQLPGSGDVLDGWSQDINAIVADYAKQ